MAAALLRLAFCDNSPNTKLRSSFQIQFLPELPIFEHFHQTRLGVRG